MDTSYDLKQGNMTKTELTLQLPDKNACYIYTPPAFSET